MTDTLADRAIAHGVVTAHHATLIANTPAVAPIVHEVHSAISAVRNGLAMRKAHPSYGYTKAGIQADLDRAIGLAQAVAILAGLGTTSSAAYNAFDALGIDVRDLARTIKHTK